MTQKVTHTFIPSPSFLKAPAGIKVISSPELTPPISRPVPGPAAKEAAEFNNVTFLLSTYSVLGCVLGVLHSPRTKIFFFSVLVSGVFLEQSLAHKQCSAMSAAYMEDANGPRRVSCTAVTGAAGAWACCTRV